MSTPAVDSLLASIRKRCKSGLWSQGVTLARAGAVAVESQSADEIVLRVRAPGRVVPPTVVLYPTENEWECDCPSRISPCEHVAAVAITLGEAKSEAAEAGTVPATALGARVGYRFVRAEEGLQLGRVLVAGDGVETALEGGLRPRLANPTEAAALQVEEADLQVDALLATGGGARGVLSPGKLHGVMQLLAGAPRISVDGVPAGISAEEVLPQATLIDARRGDGAAEVRLTIAADPRVRAVVASGVALCEDEGHLVLRPLGEIELTGDRLQHLPVRRAFGAADLGELVTVVLPDLARRTALDNRSRQLPPVVRDLEPRIVLQLDQLDAMAGGGLSVLPALVYGAPPCARIDGGKLVHLRGPVPLRDPPAERRAVERLRADLDLLPGRRTNYAGADAPRFVEKLKRWRGDLSGGAAGVVKPAAVLEPHLSLATDGDAAAGTEAVRFDLTFTTKTGASVEAGAVVRAWEEGLGIVPLTGGGWASLPLGWMQKHGQRVADLLAARQDDGHLARHALPALAALCSELDYPPPPGLDRLAPLIAGFERLPEAPLPGDLTATLRPYQQQGVSWLSFLRSAGLGGILADDMGLGKTLQAMCVFDAGPAKGTTLVVAPTSVIFNWQAELGRFRPTLKVCVYHGANRALDPDADVTLTSYALLRLDEKRLAAQAWRTVVLDEAQAIKNPDSQTARAAFALRASFRLALTGTPVENRLEELWSLMHFANRGLLGGRADFADRHARPIADGAPGAAAALRQRVRPFLLRRLKQDVAPELPPRTDAVLRVELGDGERTVYDAVRAATQKDVLALFDGGAGGVMKALEALLRLRQAACHPALVPGQTAATSSKVEALLEALETAVAENHKALVFSQWTSLLDLIEPALARAELPFVRLDGSTRDRGEVVSRFQADDGPPVMLVSLKAGGSGLNLTAADHVFLCDPWWNPAVEAQAADRTHRIGQTRPVFVYRLVAADTVEERILALQDSKRALMDAALGDGSAAAGLTKADLLALLA